MYVEKNISVNTKMKIISELYLPVVIDNEIIYFQNPIYPHKKFIEEHHNKFVNFIIAKQKKESKKYELSCTNGKTS